MRSLILLMLLTSQVHADVITGVVRGGGPGVRVDVYEQDDRIRTTTAGEDGRYTFDVPAGTYVVVAYTERRASELRLVVVAGDEELADLELAPNAPVLVHGSRPNVEVSRTPSPVMIYELARIPTARDRTHRAWVGMSAAADRARAVTTVDGAPRFTTAPGIPLAFLDELTNHTFRIPIALPAGSGAVDIHLANAGEASRGTARLVLGLDRDAPPLAAVEAVVTEPLATKRAWLAGGLATDQHGDASGMAALRYTSGAHTTELAAIASERDAWASAGWSAKMDELRLSARLTGERLVTPAALAARTTEPLVDDVATRFGPTFVARHTGDKHAVTAALGFGEGRRGDAVHRDASWAVGDEWQLGEHLRIDAGVRGEYRRYGDDEVHLASPRISVFYAVASEGNLLAGYQRLPRLDDGLPGAWRGQRALYHDEVTAGGSRMIGSEVLIGVAGRARRTAGDTAFGGDAWLHIEKSRTMVIATAASIERTAAFLGLYTFHRTNRTRMRAGLTLRTDPTSNEAGGALAWWQAQGKRRLDVQLEAFAGTRGPGARLVAGANW